MSKRDLLHLGASKVKAHVGPAIKAHLIRGAFYLLLAGTLLAFFSPKAPAKGDQRTLSFAQRITYQRAIEEVYWRHRIWPNERPNPKPPLDAMMSQGRLEKKVQNYLRESQALEDYWQRPITAEQLQDEMDRMAQHTKKPEVLRELFTALGNDPFVIAECLARPMLSERLFRSALAFQNTSGAMSQPVSPHKANGVSFYSYTLSRIVASSKEEGTCNDAWAATSTVNAPTARQLHTAVWTGSEMIVWGGHDQNFLMLNTGGRYDPATDSWLPISTNNVPDARYSHTAVWTGTEMIVWGGDDQNILPLNTGGRYDPATDSWLATSTNNVPDARYGHTAVWTGSEMIVWGGFGDIGTLNTGARYNPSSDSWTATGTTNAPSPRYFHTAVWIGSEMIVWGGRGDTDEVNTGGRYNPGTDVWTTTSTTGAPDARESHTAVWTGDEMIVWGGFALGVGGLSTGGGYNSGTDTWTATNVANAPEARYYQTAVWTGGVMIVWGGVVNGSTFLRTGGRYDASSDTWVATTANSVPEARAEHTAVWTGSEMIVWGGQSGLSPFVLNTGGRYCGQYPTPPPSPITVTNTNDSGPGSLRQALVDANDGYIIDFAVTGTIGLTSGELLVTKNITISGPGAENLAVNGNANGTVFHVIPGETVTISRLTITNGSATDFGGGIHNDHATLTLNNSAVTGNQGGGIYNDAADAGPATLVINNSSLTDNSGGGVDNNGEGGSTATLEITDSILSTNSGSAIHSHGFRELTGGNGTATVQITNSTIAGNQGDAIFNNTGVCCPVTVSLNNSTVSANGGAAVYNSIFSQTVVSNSTISGNGSGIYTDLGVPISGSGVFNSTMNDDNVEIWNTGSNGSYVENTIFKVSFGGHSILLGYGTVVSGGYNLSSDDGGGYLNGPGDQINTDPMLSPLQDNGGPTSTHELLPGSPAINAGDPNFVPPPYYDQRGPGFDRIRGNRIDVGSFEVQNPPRPTPTPRPRPSPLPRP